MIKRLYVHNFRCLENFELNLADKPSSLLIGRNGTGKSAIGLVLRALQSIGSGINKVNEIIQSRDIAFGRSGAPVRLEIEFNANEFHYKYSLALQQSTHNRRIAVSEESLEANSVPVMIRSREFVNLYGTQQSVSPLTLEVGVDTVALPVFGASIHMGTVTEWLGKMLILAPIPQTIRGGAEGETVNPKKSVINLGEWVTGILKTWPAAYSHIDRHLKTVMPDFGEFQIPLSESETRGLAVKFAKDQSTLTLPFNEISDGEKCIFISAVVVAANRVNGPLLCYWDVPDNYLAPDEVGHFVMALRKSFQAGGQLLVTSHNPEAVRQFSNDNTFVLRRNSHLEPTIVRGWGHVISKFQEEHIAGMPRYPNRHVSLLIDFDQHDDRRTEIEEVVPPDLIERVFVLGAWKDPEELSRSLKLTKQEIVNALAEDCRTGSTLTWDHKLLKHNASELNRMTPILRPILMNPQA